jgi:hypothetical protein
MGWGNYGGYGSPSQDSYDVYGGGYAGTYGSGGYYGNWRGMGASRGRGVGRMLYGGEMDEEKSVDNYGHPDAHTVHMRGLPFSATNEDIDKVWYARAHCALSQLSSSVAHYDHRIRRSFTVQTVVRQAWREHTFRRGPKRRQP